ncbi:hypothetical protein D3C72_1953850 [compost metagenome]
MTRREGVPAELGEVAVKVQQQVIGDQIGQRRQANEIGRIVLGQDSRRVLHHVGELVFLDVEGDIGELLGELLCQARRQREAGLEIGIEHDWVSAAARRGQCRACGGGDRQAQGGNAKCVAG